MCGSTNFRVHIILLYFSEATGNFFIQKQQQKKTNNDWWSSLAAAGPQNRNWIALLDSTVTTLCVNTWKQDIIKLYETWRHGMFPNCQARKLGVPSCFMLNFIFCFHYVSRYWHTGNSLFFRSVSDWGSYCTIKILFRSSMYNVHGLCEDIMCYEQTL